MSLETMTAPTWAPVLPQLDRPDADELADGVLLSAAATVKVATVHAGSSRTLSGARVSTRAWTRGGRVD